MPSPSRTVLAIETSCDETAVAVLRGTELLASEVASQIALHAEYGGVVPEVASRNHLRTLKPVVRRALADAGVTMEQIDAFAATCGPGLATSLMIGTSAAKGLAVARGKPYLAVNHIEGHLLSPFFGSAEGVRPARPSAEPPRFPSASSVVALLVSGGHTLLVEIKGVGRYRLLGQTQDDAAGEAFDKVGKLLGLPYPGGPNVNRLASEGDPARFDFPRSMMDSGDFDFSFSGLKTSVRYLLPKLELVEAGAPRPARGGACATLPDLCASFQEAIVDVLVAKTLRAARKIGHGVVAVSGGVSCNSRLREKMRAACEAQDIECLFAEPSLCTDNAAMIGYVAALRLAAGDTSPLSADIDPNLRLVE